MQHAGTNIDNCPSGEVQSRTPPSRAKKTPRPSSQGFAHGSQENLQNLRQAKRLKEPPNLELLLFIGVKFLGVWKTIW